MFGGKGGLGNLMKQAQEMQKNMQAAQEEIAQMEITGEAGGGMVKVVMTGKHELVKVDIDDSLMETVKCWKTCLRRRLTARHVVLRKKRRSACRD